MSAYLYYINGFRETENYFKSIGRFTADEWDRLVAGESINKGGNEFYIKKM